MRIFDIALKDMTQLLRDKRTLLFMVLMPVVFTLFMGFAFRSSGQPADTRLAVGWINQDPNGLITDQLHQTLTNSESIRLVELGTDTLEAASQQVVKGQLAAALVVPAGFSQKTLAGQKPQMTLIADPLSGNGQSALELLRVPVTRLLSAAQVGVLHTAGLPAGKVDAAAETQAAFQAAAGLWQQVTQNGPQVKMEKAQGATSDKLDLAANPYAQSSPGMLVMFAIFGLINTANLLVLERKSRTLERMRSTSLSKAGIIGGHLLATFSMVFFQQLLLVAFGQLVLKVDYFREPLATLLVMVGVALFAAALGLLIGVAAQGEDRVVLYAMLAMFVFSALGGAWFPLEGAGSLFTTIGKLTPGSWAMTGFQNILVRGLDSASVLLPCAALAAYALGFFGLAVWRFKN